MASASPTAKEAISFVSGRSSRRVSEMSAHTALFSEYFGVCRICLEDANRNKLISPCKCKGSHAYVHKACLKMWFDNTRRSECEICKTKYSRQSTGFKPFSEWQWPKPLSDHIEDEVDFYLALLWIPFVLRMLHLVFSESSSEMAAEMNATLGNGWFKVFWWVSFLFNTAYYSSVLQASGSEWWQTHQVYEWDFMAL